MKKVPSWNFFRNILRIYSIVFYSQNNKNISSEISSQNNKNISSQISSQNNKNIKKILLHKVFEVMSQAFIEAHRKSDDDYLSYVETYLFMKYAMAAIKLNYKKIFFKYYSATKVTKKSSIKICCKMLKNLLSKAYSDYTQSFNEYFEGAKRIYDKDIFIDHEYDEKDDRLKHFFEKFGIVVDIKEALSAKFPYWVNIVFKSQSINDNKYFIDRVKLKGREQTMQYASDCIEDHPYLCITNDDSSSFSYVGDYPTLLTLLKTSFFRKFLREINMDMLYNLTRSFFDRKPLLQEVFLQNIAFLQIHGLTRFSRLDIASLEMNMKTPPYEGKITERWFNDDGIKDWKMYTGEFSLCNVEFYNFLEKLKSENIMPKSKSDIDNTSFYKGKFQELGKSQVIELQKEFDKKYKPIIQEGLSIFHKSLGTKIRFDNLTTLKI